MSNTKIQERINLKNAMWYLSDVEEISATPEWIKDMIKRFFNKARKIDENKGVARERQLEWIKDPLSEGRWFILCKVNGVYKRIYQVEELWLRIILEILVRIDPYLIGLVLEELKKEGYNTATTLKRMSISIEGSNGSKTLAKAS